MNINMVSQNSFGARFSQDTTTQQLLKEGIETHPYQVYEAHTFLEKIKTNDEISLSRTVSENGPKYFIQLNNNDKIECKPRVISYSSPIVNLLKQLSFTIAQGGEEFNKIFGSKVWAIGDFAYHSKHSVDSFINRPEVTEYSNKISKLEAENRNLKFEILKTKGETSLLQKLMSQNDLKIKNLKELCFAKDKEFVSKALRLR